MFKKIVSSLPFSPALIGQLGFYAKRLKKEEITRRLAFVFIALTLLVQSIAILQPTESANASSANDMITGGVYSLSRLLSIYDNNTKNLKDVMNYAGITREEIASAKYGSWKIGDTLSWGFLPKFSYSQGERQHNITTSSGSIVTIYSRPQKLWSSSTKTVYGWTGNSKTMGRFSILENCGNLVTTKTPAPALAPKPAPTPAPAPTPKPVPTVEVVKKTPVIAPKPIIEPKCVLNPDILANDPNCKPCPGNDTIWINDKTCKPDIKYSKSSLNISQDYIDATTVTAKAGDRISFTITIENIGLNSDKVKIEDNLIDTLEYSNLIDTGGGMLDKTTQILSWPEITLSSKEKQTRTFVVKVLDSIPTTAQGKSDGTSYDCKILNTFGNSININVDCPTVKIVEQVSAELPKTGPKESLIFICTILALTAYFFTRTKQLEKEIKIIRNNANAGNILL